MGKNAAETIAALELVLSQLKPSQREALFEEIQGDVTRKALWQPDHRNEPQIEAYYSGADLLLYGGAAGGGKTDLLIGTALTNHSRSVIFRRQAVDLRGIEERIIELCGREGWNGADKIFRRDDRVLELGHLGNPGTEENWRGRPHDFIGFDEGAQLSKAKVQFVMGWLRSVNPGQRRRVVIATNPPTGGEGDWLVEWFAPWLDPGFAQPADPGELRWAVTAPDRDGTTLWVGSPRPVVFTGERSYRPAEDAEILTQPERVVSPLSRSFIPSRLRDNPYLADTGYRAQLQALPEQLRVQLLEGDFLAHRIDHEQQVIPTAWVRAAMDRWTEKPPNNAKMTAIGVDVAQGGGDDTVLAIRHGHWFANCVSIPGVDTATPSSVAGLVVRHRRDNAIVVIDVSGGYGGGVKERLEENGAIVYGFNWAGEGPGRTADGALEFVNKRAWAMWRFREALDPDQPDGSPIALPPDPQVMAELTAPRWKLSPRGIQIESKDDLKKAERLGKSPDRADAIIMAWSEGERAIVSRLRRKSEYKPKEFNSYPQRGTGWMGT